MAWLRDGKKFEDIIIRFHATHERDGQTHRQTDRQTPHADIGHAYASHRAAMTTGDIKMIRILRATGEKL